MSTIKGDAIRGDARQGQFTSAWRTINDATTLKPQTYGELVKLYGDGLKFVDALTWGKKVIDISTRAMNVLEEGHFWDVLPLTAVINAGAAGADITITSSSGFGRLGFVVHVPAMYLTAADVPQSYLIHTKAANGGDWDYICSPLLATTQIAVQLPVGQNLIVGASQFAAGSQQPAGAVNDYFKHTHSTRIIKETIHFEGGQNALQEWPDLSQSEYGSSLYAREVLKAQLKMRLQANDVVLMGYPNTNSLTETNRFGETNDVLGDYGLIPAMAATNGAMKQYYTGSYNEDNLDVVKFLLASQGIAGMNSVFFGLGQELFTTIENNMLKFIREYSGGTKLYYDDLNKVGFNVREILKNNTRFYLCEIPEFSDPTRYAANNYNFETMGLIFPDSKVTATLNGFDPRTFANKEGEKRALNHVTVGYLNYGRENRRMIVGNKAGINGMGIPFSDAYDDSSMYALSEMMVINLALNQTILVLRTDL